MTRTRSAVISLAIALLSSLVAVSQAGAWGSDGHRIIGTIASANFDEATAKAVRELLGETTMADACCWADEIRNDHSYDWIKPLHYINVPRGAESIDMVRDGAEGQQVITTIIRYRDILKDPTRNKEERLLALRLVAHMVGDIHQPMHVSYKDDLGGNKISLQAFGRKSNLHRAWDSDLIRRRLKDTKGGWPVMSADLRQAITAEQRAAWTKSLDPIDWANESLAITRTIYSNMPKAPGDVDDSYYALVIPTVNERLQAAGLRLAALLNQALAESGTDSVAPSEPSAPAGETDASKSTPPPKTPPRRDRAPRTPRDRTQVSLAGTMACTAGRLR